MNISEIEKSEDECLHGLVLDKVPATIPEGLKEVSVRAVLKSGALCPEFVTKLVTLVIKCKPKGVFTILEFKDLEPSMVSRLILICGNLQVGISLIPPTNFTPESLKKYKEVLNESLVALLKFRGSAPYLFPVCNYLEYMAANVLSGVSSLEPKDLYTKSTFKEALPSEWIDDIKFSLADTAYDFLGGKERFEESVRLMAYVTSNSVEGRVSGNG